MRSKFDEQLAALNHELISMGALCEEVIAIAAKALICADREMALKVPPIDAQIDRKEREIESMCLRLLLQQQPVAKDLRQISAALKMITDMERIGDQASDIAEIIGVMDLCPVGSSTYVADMARAAIKMVTDSIDAFVKKDVGLARMVIKHDDVVDDLFVKVKDSLISMIVSDNENGEYEIDILMIAKYFERIGDHAVNIAEWVVFAVTGVHNWEEQK